MFLSATSLFAQEPYRLLINGDPENILIKEDLNLSKSNSSNLELQLNVRIEELRRSGYWLANLDSLYISTERAEAFVFIGKKYDGVLVVDTNLEETTAAKVGLAKNKLPRKYSSSEIMGLLDDITHEFENQGYPFGAVKLDSFRFEKKVLECKLLAKSGRLILFDSLGVKNGVPVKPKFLSRYLGVTADAPFSQTTIDNIDEKIRVLSFLDLNQAPSVYFGLQRARVDLKLAKRKVNSFDGILGLVPGATGRKPELTGELKFEIQNLFREGKSLDFHWKKVTAQTQQLHLNYAHPFILGSPLNFEFSFNQLKENIAFSNRSIFLGLDFFTSVTSRFQFFYENKNGNKLDDVVDENGDFSMSNYGLGFEFTQLDDPLLPTRGLKGELKSQIGFKKTTNAISSSTQTQQLEASANLKFYRPVGKQSVFFAGLSGGWIDGDNLFLNDLFRLGGLNSIRGFNENFFFASKYALANFEWQIHFDRNSYIFLFLDQSLLKKKTQFTTANDNPTGMGIGLKVEANGGFFSLVYGLGRFKGEEISFNQSKIHFGYSARF